MVTDPTERTFPLTPLSKRIFAVADALGCEARIAGGAVRDWARRPDGAPITTNIDMADIDMAIACPVERAADALRKNGLKVVETGLAHGTVTVIDGDETIELTQTRRDVETDGRHAVVAFTDDWRLDASRRDFTVNAFYVDSSGRFEDPLGGLPDLSAGRLRFVGDPRQRIDEDALRMLRFCRFLPLFDEGGTDPDAAAAIIAKADAASTLSGERIASECRRLLSMRNPLTGLFFMQESGLARAALGGDLFPQRLALLPSDETLVDAASWLVGRVWLLRLAAVLAQGSLAGVARRLKLSRADSRLLCGLDEPRGDVSPAELANEKWWRPAWMLLRRGDDPVLQYAVHQARSGVPVDSARLRDIAAFRPVDCPVVAGDLLSQGVDKGPALGEMLRTAERLWVAHDFTLSRDELLAQLLGSVRKGR